MDDLLSGEKRYITVRVVNGAEEINLESGHPIYGDSDFCSFIGWVEPEQTCHWEWSVFGSEPDTYEAWNCSICGEVGDALEEPPDYCPWCGHKVVDKHE